jgi:hypothetical protein
MVFVSIRVLALRLTAYLVNKGALTAKCLRPLFSRDLGLYQPQAGRPRMSIRRSLIKIISRDKANLIADRSFAILVKTRGKRCDQKCIEIESCQQKVRCDERCTIHKRSGMSRMGKNDEESVISRKAYSGFSQAPGVFWERSIRGTRIQSGRNPEHPSLAVCWTGV